MSLLRKAKEYLFKDFEYVSHFGSKMDYEAYWYARVESSSEMERAMYQNKFELIGKLIKPGSSVLDIGCGDGSLLAYLKLSRGIKPYGVEVSGKACALAKQKGIEVLQADIAKDEVPLLEVNYIVMSEVLEHLPNPEEVMLKVRDKFTTALLIDIPNTGALNDRLRLLLGRTPKQWVFHAGEHLRFWTVTDFLFLCKQLGYKVDRYYGLYDPYYQLGLRLWNLYPRLFARYVLYDLRA